MEMIYYALDCKDAPLIKWCKETVYIWEDTGNYVLKFTEMYH